MLVSALILAHAWMPSVAINGAAAAYQVHNVIVQARKLDA